MLRHQLLHPEITAVLARAGHTSQVLIADGNYPASSTMGPHATLVSLNLAPGVVTVRQVLETLMTAIPIEAVHTMGMPEDDPHRLPHDPPVWEEYRAVLRRQPRDSTDTHFAMGFLSSGRLHRPCPHHSDRRPGSLGQSLADGRRPRAGNLMASRMQQLNEEVVACQRCPRLLRHCQQVAVEKRRAYADRAYWGRPVPNFGSPRPRLLIVGLAPGAHGANRTGRMFTGDRSGDWLFRALHRAGFANQASSAHARDGLRLKNCLITAVCHCAPPDNRPTADEVANCGEWFRRTIELVNPPVIVCLGKIAWDALFRFAKANAWYAGRRPAFGHGTRIELPSGRTIFGSYHPSQQNTFTGRLTEPMLDDVFRQARRQLDRPTSR